MNIRPVTSPSAIPQAQPSSAASAKARAISIIQGTQPAQEVVPNQNQIAVEEIGAVKATEGQLDTREIPAETESQPEPAKDPALSRQFAQLAKQTRQLRIEKQRQAQEFKAKEDAVLKREQELQDKYKEPDLSQYIPRARLKEDALSVLTEEGVTYDSLTQQVLNHQPTDPRVSATISKLEDQIREMRAERDQDRLSQVESQNQQYQAAVRQIETDVKALVNSDPEFETIKAAKAHRAVVKLIEDTYNKDGILLSNEEAAKEVEEELINRALAYDNISKIQKRRELARSANAARSSKTVEPKQPQTMKTLTNATSSSRQLSAKERAILAFKGELKP